MTVHIVDELSKDFENGRVVDLKLLIHSLGNCISGITVDVLASRHKVLLDACQCSVLPHIQMNDLVRNNSQALECQSLSASSREALNDPTLVLFLKTSNLL